MLTRLQISVGGGHATLTLDVSRSAHPARGRRLGLLAILLVMPIVLLIGAQSIGLVTRRYSLDRIAAAPGSPWVYLLTAATLGVVLTLGIVLVARLRIVGGRQEGSRQLTVTLRLTALEALAFGIAVGLLALFLTHLAADGLACARGLVEAC